VNHLVRVSKIAMEGGRSGQRKKCERNGGQTRVRKPTTSKRPPPTSIAIVRARANGGSGRPAVRIISVVGPIAASLPRPLKAKGKPIINRPTKGI
jgi:hypothetical protein